jgi:hypothetical protein
MIQFILKRSVLAFCALFLVLMAAEPTKAQGFSFSFGTGFYDEPAYYPPPPPPVFAPRPIYRPAYEAPFYEEPVYRAPPRCFFRKVRHWNGSYWEMARQRVCR